MHITGMLRGLLLAAGIVALAAPSLADIKSFNAAMKVKDYKAAAAAAASTWPGLDKSRKDLAVIAREFGFAAYLAGDLPAAKTYGEAASAASRVAAEEPALVIASDLLWRLAEHQISPNGDTRGRLFTLLQSRATHPGIDLVAYVSASALTAYDFDKGHWRNAAASAALGGQLTADEPGYLETNFQFEIVGATATYMVEPNMKAHDVFRVLQERVVSAIAAAPPEASIADLEKLYHETNAWIITTHEHLDAMHKLRDDAKRDEELKRFFEGADYRAATWRIRPPLPEGVCPVSLAKDTYKPTYPRSLNFRGMIGTIILKTDVDATGKGYSARVAAAAPGKEFAEAALKTAPKMMFNPQPGAASGCTLAQKDKVVIVSFTVP